MAPGGRRESSVLVCVIGCMMVVATGGGIASHGANAELLRADRPAEALAWKSATPFARESQRLRRLQDETPSPVSGGDDDGAGASPSPVAEGSGSTSTASTSGGTSSTGQDEATPTPVASSTSDSTPEPVSSATSDSTSEPVSSSTSDSAPVASSTSDSPAAPAADSPTADSVPTAETPTAPTPPTGETPAPAEEQAPTAPTGETPSPVEGGPTDIPIEAPSVATSETPVTSPPYAPSMCSNGIPGYQDGKICCKEECGQCGGVGCGAIPGTSGGADCCPSTIEAAGVICGDAPCIIEGITPAPTMVPGTPAPYAPSLCSNGIPGVDDGVNVCCKENCGQCGGAGCGSIQGTNGASDCCPDTIKEESGGLFCGDAPCVMEGYTPAPVNPAFSGTASPVAPSVCSNGLPGYQDGDACCVEACGQCGGAGCGTIPGTGGSENCCSTAIRAAGVVCGEPPCIIEGYTPAPAVVGGGTAAPSGSSVCTNGFPGFQDGAVCCAANCGQCGGLGCGAIPGTGGSAACCSSIIQVEGENCSVTGEAPCIIEGYTPAPVVIDYGTAAPYLPSNCSNGLAGYQDLDVCCLEACGQCGGAGCGKIPGTGGNEFCCSATIRVVGELCGNGVVAPCIIGEYTPSPVNPAFLGTAAPVAPSTCINGMPGVQNGAACCLEACGQCGGLGCGTIPGTGGSDFCCASSLLAANEICGVNKKQPPCVIENYTPAPAAIPGEAAPFADSVCSNGFPGVQDEAACCAENCGQCGGAGCGTLNGTGGTDFCCSSSIIANGTSCSVTLEAPCFIEDWVPTPSPTELITAAPVEPGTCSNGLAGYQDKSVCCKEACGMCGGAGCGNVNGTAGPSDCCPTQILAANQTCGGKVVAPCIIAATPAPTAAPAITPVPTPTPFVSGNAPDFINSSRSSTISAADVRTGRSVVLSIWTAVIVAVVGAFAFEVHQARGPIA